MKEIVIDKYSECAFKCIVYIRFRKNDAANYIMECSYLHVRRVLGTCWDSVGQMQGIYCGYICLNVELLSH